MINELAKKLFDRIKELIDKNLSFNEIKKIIKDEFQNFNNEVQKFIESELNSFKYTPNDILIGVSLSNALYNNAKEATNKSAFLIHSHIKSKKTINELARKLYEGYNFRDKEVLEVKKRLPKYLLKELNNTNIEKKLLKKVNKLKTSHLKASYTQVLEAVSKQDKKALQKALKTAVEEKARFYANRIAQTEIFRAKNYQNAIEYLEDEEIEFVKFEMSSHHPKADICDFYANLDIGYGRGIIPKKEMRTLPLHSFCGCKYIPHYLTKKEKEKFSKIKPLEYKKAQKKQ